MECVCDLQPDRPYAHHFFQLQQKNFDVCIRLPGCLPSFFDQAAAAHTVI